MPVALKLLALAAALTCGACGSDDGSGSPARPQSVQGQEYVLGFGETIRIGALSLEFTTLAEDSRCPLNAACVWEGNARILVTATEGTETAVLALNTAAHLYPSSGTFAGYRIELRALAPYPPWSNQPVETYEATLFVERARP